MAHQPNNRRILAAALDIETPMDPTHKIHPKSTTKVRHHPHPHPDPTIQNISHRFSKLYANHKKSVAAVNSFIKPQSHSHLPLHPEPETDLQAKPTSFFPVSDTQCTALTKSNSHHERNNLSVAKFMEKEYYLSTKTKVKGRDEIKKPSSKKGSKKASFQEFDVKKASLLMSKSTIESDKMKKFEEGLVEVRRRSSISSSINLPPPAHLVNGGRRKSFCSSQVELADFLSCSGVKVVAVDMPPFMQIHAVDFARKTHDSLEKFTSKTLASSLKREFDGVYGPAWHCIVGTSFGSFVTHSVGGFMYFSMDHKLYVLLFKTTVQRAE